MNIPSHHPQVLIDEALIAEKILEQDKFWIEKQLKNDEKNYQKRIDSQVRSGYKPIRYSAG